MRSNINADLVREFRGKMNQYSFIRQHFSNLDGRNKWNIICSAMDWITVVSEGLPNIHVDDSEGVGCDSIQSLGLMQYVIAVDLLVESVIQLWRVIVDENIYPLAEDKTIFGQNMLSDDKYFKHLRAAFGTHPVNLTSVDGVQSSGDERFYACWSYKPFDIEDGDFTVTLYSNLPERENVSLYLRLSDIELYCQRRYSLLNDLIEKIDGQAERHISLCI